MASVKRYNSNIIIQSTGISSNITLDAETVIIPGDFTVLGTTTSIETTNTTIKDKIITLNDGETDWGVGGNASPGTAGIEVDRGLAGKNTLRWNESTDKWELTVDGGVNYTNILTGTGGVGLTAVVDDTAPVLGGNLNVDGRVIYGNVGVTLQGVLELKNTSTIPGSAFNTSTIFYANTAGAGTTGLYVLNDQATNEELVTKRRAFGFSLIL